MLEHGLIGHSAPPQLSARGVAYLSPPAACRRVARSSSGLTTFVASPTCQRRERPWAPMPLQSSTVTPGWLGSCHKEHSCRERRRLSTFKPSAQPSLLNLEPGEELGRSAPSRSHQRSGERRPAHYEFEFAPARA